MGKTFWVAWREFTTTVMTKAFIIAVVLPPLLMTMAFTLMPLLMNKAAPKVTGRIAVLDKSGAVVSRLTDAFTPDKMKSRHGKKFQEHIDKAPAVPGVDAAVAAKQVAAATEIQTQLTLEQLPDGTDIEAAKKEMAQVNARAGIGNRGWCWR
jgi:ABC-type Na+ efflux pump permease subunit